MARASRLLRVLAAAALLAPAVSGCSSSLTSSGAPDKGFLDSDGTITKVAVADRRDPVSFRGTTLEGDPFDVTDFRGKVVVVNVWASWCGPCIKEAPALQQVWAGTRADGVQFVGVDTRDQTAAARAHQRRFGVTYPSVDDDSGRVLLALRGILPPKAPPSTLVLDRQGRVAYRVLEGMTAATLRGIVEDALAEKPAQAHTSAAR
jgi:thiol-disulfide isomerase/thioredoxin